MGAVRGMRWRWVAAATIAVAASAHGAERAPPARIVSVNLCADQLLLDLADRATLLALSPFATDPALSLRADAARGIATTGGSAEEVLALRPDLVVAGAFSPRATREMLRRLDVPVLDLDVPTTVAGTIAQVRALAARLGRPSAADPLVEPLERLFAEAPRPGQPRPRALYLDRRGLVAGRGTLIDDLFRLAGYANAADVEGFAVLDIERILATRADVILTHPRAAEASDQGSAMLHHPALTAIASLQRRVVVPQAATICPTTALVDVARALRAARSQR